MRNGDLFVLSEWQTDATRSQVLGTGTQYDPMRVVVATGSLSVPVDSVAVFETNVMETSNASILITTLAVVTVAVAIYCATNPKACFGSCPTFYLAGIDRPVAEGFSASIAPSLEATDVDALPLRMAGGGPLEVVMKNEALETHVVNFVNVLALPHPPDAQVFALDDGTFCAATGIAAPVAAVAPEGDCLEALSHVDGVERFSLADSVNLAARETLEVTFADTTPGARGLVIACRQSLLSTYLLYQTFAYMGTSAGYWIAQIERGGLDSSDNRILDLLGGVAMSIESSPGVWTPVGGVTEFGPIAIDQRLIPFDAPAGWTGRARVEVTKGGWRIDRVALATRGAVVEPVRLEPVAVTRAGVPDEATLSNLLDPGRSLTTLPGDTYTLVFALPDADLTYDVFLESRGYYLEWIREEWLRDESPAHLAEVLFKPEQALMRLAPEYKKIEPSMESVFWSSRYAK